MSVNGEDMLLCRTPAQVEILAGSGVTDQYKPSMLPVGLSGVRKSIVKQLSNSPEPVSQAQLARDLGRSRASVHSAITVLRNRGIISEWNITCSTY